MKLKILIILKRFPTFLTNDGHIFLLALNYKPKMYILASVVLAS